MRRTRPEIAYFGRLIGDSPEMAQVFEMVTRASEVSIPVLIEGESGTGKELVAREIHARSARQQGPFVAVNAGALSSELVASELFGHVKGAFTGAVVDYEGHFSEADNGSLFLDEIATMSERIQVVFLRVLEDGIFRPVGAKQEKKVDVRLIAATNVDLRQAVVAGRFREDLLQRLTVFRIVLPALREHLQDLPMLAFFFLDQVVQELGLEVTAISEEALDALAKYPWPGNIRELKNAIAQAAIMARQGVILPEHIPPRIVSSRAGFQVGAEPTEGEPDPLAQVDFVSPMGLRLEEVQRAYVLKTFAACAQNKTRAAKLLGISRKTLRDWLARWATISPER